MSKVNIQTAIVPLKYINVVNPDTKYSPDNPKFQVSWTLDPKAGKAFIAEVQEKMPGFKVPHNRDDDDNYIFKASQKKFIHWVDRKSGMKMVAEFTPTLLNSDNSKYEGKEPWGGSTGEVAFTIRETRGETKGITFALRGIRFHDVKIGTGEESGDNDPLFGNNTKPVEGVPAQPVQVELEDDDDIPFN